MRLRRSTPSGPGIHRVGAGRGFFYRDDDGRRVINDADLTRIRELALPPAWQDVWICPVANGHIQATGRDAAGRLQYVYHPAWRAQKDRVKYARALDLAATLPTARARVTRALRRSEPTLERALATAFRLLDEGSLRVGSERYADEHGSRGLSTLLCEHASVSGDTITLRFPAKSGQPWQSTIADPDLAAVIRALLRREPGERLLAWRDGTEWHPLDAERINGYVRDIAGGPFTAKDFRTLHGTVAAAVSLARRGVAATPSAQKRAIAQAMRDAATALGNTPAIARASYVDPRVLDRYRAGETLPTASGSSPELALRALLDLT